MGILNSLYNSFILSKVSKRKTKPAKIISKIRNRNKTFPASGDIQESNLTNKPPLVSSWVSHDTVLPEDHETEDFIQQERKEIDEVQDDDTPRDRERQLRLPPLISEFTSTTEY